MNKFTHNRDVNGFFFLFFSCSDHLITVKKTFKCKHFTVLLCNDQINTELNLINYYCNQTACECGSVFVEIIIFLSSHEEAFVSHIFLF